ncbi:MAG: CheY-P-specific phosphatase CheC [Paenibacillus sp. RIFOXYA1_FULL_44_5]|nr:MAG: CheY-P-specific phosphatase CheC [Paenibacillus sp. RIFOXYA1_FULL_44_5]
MDVLKEVGNIGAGNAATSLSKMMNKVIDMQVPKVEMLDFEEIPEKLGGSENVVIAVFLRFEGEAPGNIFFVLQKESANRLLKNLAGIEVQDANVYTEMELSALNEIGNILAGSYLTSLADFTSLNLTPSVPSLAIDMAGAVISYGLIQFGQMGDQALLIDTVFMEGQDAVEGHFLLIPDPESFHTIFRALGVPLND